MKLVAYSYAWESLPNYPDWKVSGVDLQTLNLIVGKNATGKSRFLQTIYSLKRMLSPDTFSFYLGSWNCAFEMKDGQILNYQVRIGAKGVERETLESNGKVWLRRSGKKASLWSATENRNVEFQPPTDRLTLQVRRDLKEFPYFENLVNWANSTYGFKFGQISPHTSTINSAEDRLTSLEEIPSLISNISKSRLNLVILQARQLGFAVEEIDTIKKGGETHLSIREEGVDGWIPQWQISQGMFRAISLLLFIQYLMQKSSFSTLIVDDFGEGLDYDRVVKLGGLVYGMLEENGIQFVASSNDNFLMDSIDIKFWNILVRRGSSVTALNPISNPDLFEKFQYSGLSNFDLLSSDFLVAS